MIPTSLRIFVCTEPVDMRKSFDGLALAAREYVGEDPQCGALFVFANKRGHLLKVLWFDRNGYCILYKRLHGARFQLPEQSDPLRPVCQIDGRKLTEILTGIEKKRKRRKRA